MTKDVAAAVLLVLVLACVRSTLAETVYDEVAAPSHTVEGHFTCIGGRGMEGRTFVGDNRLL
jgi:hypothetical protein